MAYKSHLVQYWIGFLFLSITGGLGNGSKDIKVA